MTARHLTIGLSGLLVVGLAVVGGQAAWSCGRTSWPWQVDHSVPVRSGASAGSVRSRRDGSCSVSWKAGDQAVTCRRCDLRSLRRRLSDGFS